MKEDYPRNLVELEARFSTEEACREYLLKLRWPEGFVCPRCGIQSSWASKRNLLLCADCGYQASVTAGTIFQDTRKPLTLWFRAAWWVTTQKGGASALELQRVLGLGSYVTAWTWLHKFRRAMVRPGRNRLVGRVEVDETYVGGVEEGVRGREMVGKALVAVAAEEDGRGMGRIRLRRIVDASAASLEAFVEEAIQPGSLVHTDGWEGYAGLENKGYRHEVTVLRGKRQSASKLLPRVHRVASLLKRWLLGTHQGAVSHEYLDYYLDEFTFRFNRRTSRSRGKLFYRLLQQAVAADPAPYKTMVEATRAGTPPPRCSGYWSQLNTPFEGDSSQICFASKFTSIFADSNGVTGGGGIQIKNAEAIDFTNVHTNFTNVGPGMVITTGAKRVTLTGYRAHQNAGHGLLIEEDASQIIGTAMTLESNVLDGLHIVSSAIGSPTDITITGLISGDIRAVKQDSGIEIDGTTGTPDNITITAARFPGITNKVVFTGTVGQNIQIEENSDSASYSGTDDVNVLLDADASTNTASFSVQKNSADPSAATALFEVEEDGDVRVYNQGGSGFSRLIVRAGAAQSSTALQLWQNNGGAVLTKIDESGGIVPRGLSLASLGASTNGTIFYCIDCNSGTAPCTGGGTGSIAVRENSQWNCK